MRPFVTNIWNRTKDRRKPLNLCDSLYSEHLVRTKDRSKLDRTMDPKTTVQRVSHAITWSMRSCDDAKSHGHSKTSIIRTYSNDSNLTISRLKNNSSLDPVFQVSGPNSNTSDGQINRQMEQRLVRFSFRWTSFMWRDISEKWSNSLSQQNHLSVRNLTLFSVEVPGCSVRVGAGIVSGAVRNSPLPFLLCFSFG